MTDDVLFISHVLLLDRISFSILYIIGTYNTNKRRKLVFDLLTLRLFYSLGVCTLASRHFVVFYVYDVVCFSLFLFDTPSKYYRWRHSTCNFLSFFLCCYRVWLSFTTYNNIISSLGVLGIRSEVDFLLFSVYCCVSKSNSTYYINNDETIGQCIY